MTELRQRTLDLDRDHVFKPWSVQAGLSPIAFERGEGSYLWDYDGRAFLDFSSQLVFTNIGHSHPAVVAAIQEQVAKLATLSPVHATEARSEAAAAVAELFPDSHQKVFFTTGGTEAVENAIRLARQFTGRRKILSAYRSYHGNTTASIAATGDQRRWPNEYADGHAHFFGPFLYRTPFWSTDDAQECQRALEHLEQVIIFEGPPTLAGILLESVIGASGVIPPPPGYLAGVRALCDKYGLVYIADEVMVGFGRTGDWFGFTASGVMPDLVTFAKGCNSGYLPLGGIVISNAIADMFNDKMFPGGMTYSGHVLACASVVANLRAMREEGMIDNARTVGNEILGVGLRELGARFEQVGDVRGVGMFWALEFVKNPETKEPLAAYPGLSVEMQAISASCVRHGLLTIIANNRLHLAPPINLSADEAREGLGLIEQILGETLLR